MSEKVESEEFDLGAMLDEAVDAMPQTMKDLWIRTLFLLNQSDRFVEFMDKNFDIQQNVNEETKTIDLRVIELEPEAKPPSTGITMDLAKSMKLQLYLKGCGVKNTADAAKAIVSIIVGDNDTVVNDGPGIVAASAEDLKQELLKKKL